MAESSLLEAGLPFSLRNGLHVAISVGDPGRVTVLFETKKKIQKCVRLLLALRHAGPS